MIQAVTKELEASLLMLSLKKSEKSEIIIGHYYSLGEGDDRGWDDQIALQLVGHEFEQALRVGDGQGSLVCCS